MLNINEVRLMGTIDKIMPPKQFQNINLVEVVLNISTATKTAEGKWTNVDKKTSVTFFNKNVDEILKMKKGYVLYVMGEVNTKYTTAQNGNEYANTAVIGKKFQLIGNDFTYESYEKNDKSKNKDEFDMDIPF